MKREMKQTAVEWLMEIDKSRAIKIEEWQQAREMEKEQMIDWYATGQADTVNMYEQHLKKPSNTNG
jgi:hypothetical protein